MNNIVQDGICPVMLTPFGESMMIDWNGYDELLDFYLNFKISGLFAACYTSEIKHLKRDEMINLVSRAVQKVKGKIPIIAGASKEGTLEEQSDFIKDMYHTGADVVVILTGQVAREDEDEDVFKKNIEKILGLTSEIPLGIYECPNPYHRLLSADIFGWLANTGRFVFHKDTSCDINLITAKINQSKSTNLKFFNAHCATFVESLKAGGNGYCGVGTNFYPEIFTWLFENYKTADSELVEKIYDFTKFSEKYFDICDAYPATAKTVIGYRGVNITNYCRRSVGKLDAKARLQLTDLTNKVIQLRKKLLCDSSTESISSIA